VAACGGDKSGGPSGAPADVVGRAPAVTRAARTAQITINAPTAAAKGLIDFEARTGRLTVTATGVAAPAELLVTGGTGYLVTTAPSGVTRLDAAIPEVLRGGDPWADLDLMGGTVHILSDGGGEVEGASTIGYTLTIDPQQAIDTAPPTRQRELRAVLQGRTALFPMAVWIDSRLLIRRIEVPTDLRPLTPVTSSDRAPVAADVDFVAFGAPVGPISPPTGG
jgi:hypothetical protein